MTTRTSVRRSAIYRRGGRLHHRDHSGGRERLHRGGGGTCSPDVVLMDIDMPGTNGIEAVSRIHAVNPQLPVVMLTVFEDEERVYRPCAPGPSATC